MHCQIDTVFNKWNEGTLDVKDISDIIEIEDTLIPEPGLLERMNILGKLGGED